MSHLNLNKKKELLLLDKFNYLFSDSPFLFHEKFEEPYWLILGISKQIGKPQIGS